MSAPPGSSEAILARLNALHPKVIDLSLTRVERLLASLGSPHRQLPPVVHVAGTNGKGSTVAYLRAGFEAAGYRAHVYTSPHLVRFHERIVVASREISEDALVALLARCEATNGTDPITFFEITTVAAFLAFAETPADVTLLEVGMGGRLDATNVVPDPTLTIITPVDLDHQQHLGDTLAAIAGEKAGILKAGRPAIFGPQAPEAATVLAARANTLECPTLVFGRDFAARRSGDALIYGDAAGTLTLPLPALAGSHQVENAGTSLAALRALTPRFPRLAEALAAAMIRVAWPARLQRLTDGPLLAQLPAGSELYLDGGHNPHGARALAAALAELPWRPLDLVVGLLATKDAAGVIAPLAAAARRLIAVPVPGDHPSAAPSALADIARAAGARDVTTADSVPAALDLLARSAGEPPGEPGRVVIFGSLYLAGAVLAANG